MLQTEIFSKPLFFFLDYFIFHSCPAGFYQGRKGMASCLPCIPSTYNALTKQSECTKCQINKYNDQPESTSCSDCLIGTLSEEGSTKCQPCEAGSFSN